jgi:hypothetical protein
MTISGIALSSVTSLSPTTRAAAAGTAPPTATSLPEHGLGSASARTELSQLSGLFGKLQDLESSDPTKAKQVLSSIASTLSEKANSAGNADPHLQELADRFTQAASTGDLSALRPRGGEHPHHGGAGGPPPLSPSSTASGQTASYAQHRGDSLGQLVSVISDALDHAS